jgi:hypothetical protein
LVTGTLAKVVREKLVEEVANIAMVAVLLAIIMEVGPAIILLVEAEYVLVILV